MVSFGTDGWRSVIGDGFTFANVGRFGDALADMLLGRGWGERGIVVGYDRRFLSDEFAGLLSSRCACRGVRTLLCKDAAPTPAVALAGRTAGVAMAAIVTASHNSYRYNGIKLRDSTGAAAGPELVRELESRCAARGQGGFTQTPGAAPPGVAPIELLDPFPGYRAHVRGLVDIGAIAGWGGAAVHDAMHGAAAGWLARLVPGTKGIRQKRDPLFGGTPPEPILANLKPLQQRILTGRRPCIGLATDGDGDRLAAIAEDGSYVDPHHLLALLYMHLAEVRGAPGPVVRTVTTSSLIDRLARSYGAGVIVTPVGFKYVAPYLAGGGGCDAATPTGPAPVIGGEESGGVGFACHIPERDGVFAALMLLEHLALLDITLVEAVERLRAKAGRVYLGRLDFPVPTATAEAIERECCAARLLAGEEVVGCDRLDGVKLRLGDGAWLHVRASHTEPVLRLYAEAGSPGRLAQVLCAGEALVKAGGPSPIAAPTHGSP